MLAIHQMRSGSSHITTRAWQQAGLAHPHWMASAKLVWLLDVWMDRIEVSSTPGSQLLHSLTQTRVRHQPGRRGRPPTKQLGATASADTAAALAVVLGTGRVVAGFLTSKS